MVFALRAHWRTLMHGFWFVPLARARPEHDRGRIEAAAGRVGAAAAASTAEVR